MRPSSPVPQWLQPFCHPSKFLPRTERIQGTIQVRLSFQIGGFFTGPSQRKGETNEPNGMIGPFVVLLGVFHVGSSHQARDPECFADGYHIAWNLPTIFHPDLIATIQQTYLLAFCALLSQQYQLFLICVVELLQAPFGFLRSFCFARIRLEQLCSQVLHHDCMSMIVSRFTPFTDNIVIGCNQINKNFCTRFDSTNTSSARSPCDFGPLADLAISVFREVGINTVLSQIHTSRRF